MTLVDRRSHDLVEVPRSGLSEGWMDVRASAFEVRRSLGQALVAERRGDSPMPAVFRADRQLVRLEAFARRKAAEAEGITFIDLADPNQLPLFVDACLDQTPIA